MSESLALLSLPLFPLSTVLYPGGTLPLRIFGLWVANRWCELLPMPLEQKQRLMELDNPLVRLELVSDFLGRSGIAN